MWRLRTFVHLGAARMIMTTLVFLGVLAWYMYNDLNTLCPALVCLLVIALTIDSLASVRLTRYWISFGKERFWSTRTMDIVSVPWLLIWLQKSFVLSYNASNTRARHRWALPRLFLAVLFLKWTPIQVKSFPLILFWIRVE